MIVICVLFIPSTPHLDLYFPSITNLRASQYSLDDKYISIMHDTVLDK